jgi:hypothetical protein
MHWFNESSNSGTSIIDILYLADEFIAGFDGFVDSNTEYSMKECWN